jgi:DNA repair protein RadC
LRGLIGPELAGEALARYGSVRAVVMEACSGGLGRHLGLEMASVVLAAHELGRELAAEELGGAVFASPQEAGRHLVTRYATAPVERFGVLCLDVRRRVIAERIVSEGCLTASLVHPREVFRVALDARAAALVLFHNHPSGDPEPSAEDLALTRRLAAGGTLLGIEVLDHIVIGAGRFVSLKERGAL